MKLLIIGKNGQVGKSLLKEITKFPEISFLALDRAELDITDSFSVDEAIRKYNPNFIITIINIKTSKLIGLISLTKLIRVVMRFNNTITN